MRHKSSYGNHIDIAAPGTNILSCDINGYNTDNGTSMATAHVTGVASMIMMKYPDLEVPQVIERIMRTGMKMTTLRGLVKSEAMVDAESALNDVSSIKLDATTTSGMVYLSWTSDNKASRYEIEIDSEHIINNGTSTTYTHSDLQTNATHIYRVRAVHGNRAKLWSHRLFAKATEMPKSAPVHNVSSYNTSNNGYFSVPHPGAERIRIHFSHVDIDENNPDEYIQYWSDNISGSGGDEKISGHYEEGFWTHWVDGDTFTFDFFTDDPHSGIEKFRVDRLEYFSKN